MREAKRIARAVFNEVINNIGVSQLTSTEETWVRAMAPVIKREMGSQPKFEPGDKVHYVYNKANRRDCAECGGERTVERMWVAETGEVFAVYLILEVGSVSTMYRIRTAHGSQSIIAGGVFSNTVEGTYEAQAEADRLNAAKESAP